MAQKKSPKSSKQALQRQPDPWAPVDSKLLLQHLTRLMKTLEQDLLARADGSKGLTEALQARHAHDVAAERTADAYDPWRRGVVTQVAAAWVLNLVFVRVLEDRGLVDQNRIAGPGAEGSQGEFLKLAPFLTERDYLLTVFRELSHFEVTRELFDPKRNLAFRITPTGEGAKALLQVFRQGSAEAPAFRFGQADTRFLGDLYQDLSESVRKKYALLQTPDFIEAFILDRTLDPALETYGLDATTLIDPTCGSGHFLLGAFERLFDRQLKERPNQNPREAAQKALGAVFGTDINPYAVSIAKFRLMLAFLDKGGLTKLSSAPEVPLNVVVADSLFHQVVGEQPGQADFAYRPGQKTRDWFDEAFALEEDEKAKAVLGRGFAAVVGNPPYITVKDSALREKYRTQYTSAYNQYSLSAPFAERFFQLCRPSGYAGMITANSFMKREFGKKLVQEVLPKLDLQIVINTSGAYIPGHGTPTVLMFGQNRLPVDDRVLTVLAKRGEPATPADPAHGMVWGSIAEHGSDIGFENDFIAVVASERSALSKHPLSLGGGGVGELKALLEERAERTLGSIIASCGRVAHTGNDESYVAPQHVFSRRGLRADQWTQFVEGEIVRDWALGNPMGAVFPYDRALKVAAEDYRDARFIWLWPYRSMLWLRREPGGTHREIGLTWQEYSRFHPERYTGLAIAFAFVATHNHFVLDRGGKVFKQSAPIIKLPESATEDDHYSLLGLLNSSTACFWMKQVFQPKGNTAANRNHPDPARAAYEFASTGLGSLPIATLGALRRSIVALSRLIDDCAQRRSELFSARAVDDAIRASKDATELASYMDTRWRESDRVRERMVALQEEVDWVTYAAFGLVDRDCLVPIERYAELTCPRGGRPYERLRARMSTVRAGGRALSVEEGEVPAVGVLPSWAEETWKRRESKLGSSDELQLIETPVFKRSWRDTEQNIAEADYRKSRNAADFRAWLIDQVERCASRQVASFSVAQLVSDIGGQTNLARFAEPVVDHCTHGMEVHALVASIVDAESIPFHPFHAFTASGLAKRAGWEEVWALQRREDAGERIGRIMLPPEYSQGSRGKSTDFLHNGYWRLRGRLDVPKERFISYTGCESDEDKSPVYGWAGWNHLERARALAALYDARKEEGWKPERLLPMLVGLLELLPWLKQYHNAPDEAVGGERPAEEFEAFIAGELRQAGKTAQEAEREVLAWAQAGGAKSGSAAARHRAATETEEGEPESGTRSSGPPDAVDDASRARSSKAARLRKTRARDTGSTGEHDTNESYESGSPSRPRTAAAGSGSPRPGPPTPPASKRRKG